MLLLSLRTRHCQPTVGSLASSLALLLLVALCSVPNHHARILVKRETTSKASINERGALFQSIKKDLDDDEADSDSQSGEVVEFEEEEDEDPESLSSHRDDVQSSSGIQDTTVSEDHDDPTETDEDGSRTGLDYRMGWSLGFGKPTEVPTTSAPTTTSKSLITTLTPTTPETTTRKSNISKIVPHQKAHTRPFFWNLPKASTTVAPVPKSLSTKSPSESSSHLNHKEKSSTTTRVPVPTITVVPIVKETNATTTRKPPLITTTAKKQQSTSTKIPKSLSSSSTTTKNPAITKLPKTTKAFTSTSVKPTVAKGSSPIPISKLPVTTRVMTTKGPLTTTGSPLKLNTTTISPKQLHNSTTTASLVMTAIDSQKLEDFQETDKLLALVLTDKGEVKSRRLNGKFIQGFMENQANKEPKSGHCGSSFVFPAGTYILPKPVRVTGFTSA